MPLNSTAIERQLQSMLASLIDDAPAINSETDLTVDLDLESVEIMEFVVEVEDHFDIAIDLDTLSGVHTVGDLTTVVARLLES